MIFADTSIVIRLIEGTDPVRGPIEQALREADGTDRFLAVSRLAALECRCRPMREGDQDLLQLYDVFFESPEVLVIEIDAGVIEKATQLRASLGLRIPDAIHAASAIRCGASALWTTDSDFAACDELPVRLFRAS